MFKRLALVRLPSGRLKVKQNRKNIADRIGSLRFSSGGTSSATSALDDRVRYLTEGIKHGNRGCLAEGITLVETEHRQKRLVAKRLLDTILNLNKANGAKNSFRIGLSGPPGAGKSTFIEVIGKKLTSEGHKVAVLAVDPSSSTTGGSLLGDKTRMPELTKDMNAYIRPSPARGHLGGVTRSTNEAIILCEFAGYDTVIVETVGVGQSEYLVTNMVDMFILLLPPGGGDELQGIKRGIVERADLLVVTKSDGDLKSAAHRTQYEYMAALKFIRPTYANWKTKVISVSAKTKEGLEDFWKEIESFQKATENEFEAKRADQRVIWTWTHVQDGLHQMLIEDPNLKTVTHNLISQVKKGTVNPGTAADEIIESFKYVIKHSN